MREPATAVPVPRSAIPTLAYARGTALYLNLTNRCPTACAFCVKGAWRMRFEGHDLGLSREPSVSEVLRVCGVGTADIGTAVDANRFREIVFCGFGEPTYRLAELLEVSQRLRKNRRAKKTPRIRLNTVGLGSLINGRDIVSDLAGAIDAVSVSLNTADSKQWRRLHRPLPKFRAAGFEAALRFIRRCVELLPETTVTAVDLPGVDLRSCETLARSLGARFRLRPVLAQ